MKRLLDGVDERVADADEQRLGEDEGVPAKLARSDDADAHEEEFESV